MFKKAEEGRRRYDDSAARYMQKHLCCDGNHNLQTPSQRMPICMGTFYNNGHTKLNRYLLRRLLLSYMLNSI